MELGEPSSCAPAPCGGGLGFQFVLAPLQVFILAPTTGACVVLADWDERHAAGVRSHARFFSHLSAARQALAPPLAGPFLFLPECGTYFFLDDTSRGGVMYVVLVRNSSGAEDAPFAFDLLVAIRDAVSEVCEVPVPSETAVRGHILGVYAALDGVVHSGNAAAPAPALDAVSFAGAGAGVTAAALLSSVAHAAAGLILAPHVPRARGPSPCLHVAEHATVTLAADGTVRRSELWGSVSVETAAAHPSSGDAPAAAAAGFDLESHASIEVAGVSVEQCVVGFEENRPRRALSFRFALPPPPPPPSSPSGTGLHRAGIARYRCSGHFRLPFLVRAALRVCEHLDSADLTLHVFSTFPASLSASSFCVTVETPPGVERTVARLAEHAGQRTAVVHEDAGEPAEPPRLVWAVDAFRGEREHALHVSWKHFTEPDVLCDLPALLAPLVLRFRLPGVLCSGLGVRVRTGAPSGAVMDVAVEVSGTLQLDPAGMRVDIRSDGIRGRN